MQSFRLSNTLVIEFRSVRDRIGSADGLNTPPLRVRDEHLGIFDFDSLDYAQKTFAHMAYYYKEIGKEKTSVEYGRVAKLLIRYSVDKQ